MGNQSFKTCLYTSGSLSLMVTVLEEIKWLVYERMKINKINKLNPPSLCRVKRVWVLRLNITMLTGIDTSCASYCILCDFFSHGLLVSLGYLYSGNTIGKCPIEVQIIQIFPIINHFYHLYHLFVVNFNLTITLGELRDCYLLFSRAVSGFSSGLRFSYTVFSICLGWFPITKRKFRLMLCQKILRANR